MTTKKKIPRWDYAVGKGRPPKATRWKKGQCGNPNRKGRRQSSDAELIERLLRRPLNVIEGGEEVRKTGFEVIFSQLLAKESDGDRRAAAVRDRYERFAKSHSRSGGFLLRPLQNEFTSQLLESPDAPADKHRKAEPTDPAIDEAEAPRDANPPKAQP